MGHADQPAVPVSEVLVSVPGAELHRVDHGVQTLLRRGEFAVQYGAEGAPLEAQVVQARVADVVWPLGQHLPALKAGETVYTFGLEGTKETYYCLVLPRDTPNAVLDAVQDVISTSSAFTTVKQVDAAYEEADKLNGGKEAQAVAAAEQQQQQQAQQQAQAPAGGMPSVGAAPGPYAQPLPPQQQAQQAAAPAAGRPRPQLPSSGNATADKIASRVLSGGVAVAEAVGRIASTTTERIQSFTQDKIDKHQQGQAASPTGAQQQHAKISPHFTKGLKVTAKIASSAAYVSKRLADMLGDAAYSLALAVARKLPGASGRRRHEEQEHPGGAGPMTAGSGDSITPEQRSAMKTIGAAGLLAYVEVYDALERAAQEVVLHSSTAGADYIGYKYGPEAADAARDSVPVARDMLQASLNVSRLGARALVSKAAKRTAKIYLKDAFAGQHPDDQAAAQAARRGAAAVGAMQGGAGASAAAAPVPAPALGYKQM